MTIKQWLDRIFALYSQWHKLTGYGAEPHDIKLEIEGRYSDPNSPSHYAHVRVWQINGPNDVVKTRLATVSLAVPFHPETFLEKVANDLAADIERAQASKKGE